MKKRFIIIIPTFFVLSTLLFVFLFSGFKTKIKVTVNLDKIEYNQDAGIYSHTMFYIEAQPEACNEILGLGESAIKYLMVDFVSHPDDDLRKNIIMDLVDTIVQQENLTVSKQKADDSCTYYTSSGEWFDNFGKPLYEKYVGKVNARVLKSVHSNNEIYEIEQKKNSSQQRTILRGEGFEFEPGTNIPEPNDAVPPGDGVKWDTRLGCYIRDNIYYDETNEYFYMID